MKHVKRSAEQAFGVLAGEAISPVKNCSQIDRGFLQAPGPAIGLKMYFKYRQCRGGQSAATDQLADG